MCSTCTHKIRFQDNIYLKLNKQRAKNYQQKDYTRSAFTLACTLQTVWPTLVAFDTKLAQMTGNDLHMKLNLQVSLINKYLFVMGKIFSRKSNCGQHVEFNFRSLTLHDQRNKEMVTPMATTWPGDKVENVSYKVY